jgi:hypothetical protein
MSDLTGLERRLRERLEALVPAPRAVLLQVLKRPDHAGEFYGDPRTQTFAQLIDLEESAHARAVVLGELRERELRGES